jgi:hypothetical protein
LRQTRGWSWCTGGAALLREEARPSPQTAKRVIREQYLTAEERPEKSHVASPEQYRERQKLRTVELQEWICERLLQADFTQQAAVDAPARHLTSWSIF